MIPRSPAIRRNNVEDFPGDLLPLGRVQRLGLVGRGDLPNRRTELRLDDRPDVVGAHGAVDVHGLRGIELEQQRGFEREDQPFLRRHLRDFLDLLGLDRHPDDARQRHHDVRRRATASRTTRCRRSPSRRRCRPAPFETVRPSRTENRTGSRLADDEHATRDGRGSCTGGILEMSESTLHLPFKRDQISTAFRPASSEVASGDGQVRV